MHPSIDRIPPHYLPSLLPLLPLHPPVDLRTAAVYIDSEPYWQYRAQSDFPSLNLLHHGGRWKRAYCERHLQRRLEGWKGEGEEGDRGWQELMNEIRVLAPFIHTLHLTSLPSHPDLSALLRPLPRLSSLHLRYGAHRLLMDYDPSLLGMREEDSQALARLLLHTPTLVSLTLPSTLLTSPLYAALHPGVAASPSLTHLDLSHNALTDPTLHLLSALLPHSLLAFLDLSDNDFTAEGMAALGQGVKARGCRGGPLELRVGQNRVGWEGVAGLLAEAEGGDVVGVLDIVACGVGWEGRAGLIRAVRGRGGRGVRELYAACNDWVGRGQGEEEKEGGEVEGEDLMAAVQLNRSLLVLDVSMCGWGDAVLQRVQAVLDGRVEAEKAAKRKAADARK